MTGKGLGKMVLSAAMAVMACAGTSAWAAEQVTAKEAEAMVKKGVAFIKANGKEKGYAEITNKQGQFVDRDLYLMVLQMDGTMVAHGANAKLVGLNRMESKGIDGKYPAAEIIAAAKGKNTSWSDYKYSNPVSKKVEDKTMYCEHLEESVLVCGGVYKH